MVMSADLHWLSMALLRLLQRCWLREWDASAHASVFFFSVSQEMVALSISVLRVR